MTQHNFSPANRSTPRGTGNNQPTDCWLFSMEYENKMAKIDLYRRWRRRWRWRWRNQNANFFIVSMRANWLKLAINKLNDRKPIDHRPPHTVIDLHNWCARCINNRLVSVPKYRIRWLCVRASSTMGALARARQYKVQTHEQRAALQ